MQVELLATPIGGTLEILIQGTPSSTAFVFHHGGFGSSINMGPLYRAAAEFGILGQDASEPDKKICEGLAGDELAASISYGMAAGDYGIIDDLTADNSEWGIDLESITQRIEIFHGEEDRMDTPAHGHYFADKIPNSQLRMYSDEGHISLIYNRASEIVAAANKFLF